MAWMTLQNPRFLWLLLSIPLLVLSHIIALRIVRKKALAFANFEAIERVTGKRVVSRNTGVLVVRSVVFCMLILSAAGPVLWHYGVTESTTTVLAIDASASMLADDFSPNRLEAAKQAALMFLQNASPGSRVGVVSFSGTAEVLVQPTQDDTIAHSVIENLRVMTAGGTDLGEALITSVNLLISDPRSKRIILLTDGRSTVGTPVQDGVAHAVRNGVIVDTIGVASETGGKYANLEVVSRIDEDVLRSIADATGGTFIMAKNETDLGIAYASLAGARREVVATPLQLHLLIAGLLLLFVEWGLINTRYRAFP